jgi:lysophospholipase
MDQQIHHGRFALQESPNKGDTLTYGALKKGSSNAVVLVGGRTEYYQKYYETLYDLQDLDYDFYVVDLLGQGTSTRYLKDSQKGHIENYEQYIQAVLEFVYSTQKEENYQRIVGMGHSTGGLVLLNAAEQDTSLFHSIVLSAPLFQIQLGWEWGSKVLLNTIHLLGGKENYVPTTGPYTFNTPLNESKITQSEARHKVNDYFMSRNPKLAIGGPTVQWVLTSIEECTRTREKEAFAFQRPVYLIQPQEDQIVGLEAQNKVCNKLKQCTLFPIPNSKHEVFLEKDMYRDKAIQFVKNIWDL